MDFHERSASGESVETLREEYKDGHFLIYGVDYWDEINNGIPSGTGVTVSILEEWSGKKAPRYGQSQGYPSSQAVANEINKGNAWINSKPERLQIINQVVTKDNDEIAAMAQGFIFELLKIK